MDILDRRELLITQQNPDMTIDYLVSLEGQIKQPRDNNITIKIAYVPDQEILQKRSLISYFEGVSQEVFPSLEYTGILLLNDFCNELVPRWLTIILSQDSDVDSHFQRHKIRLQDRQPNWSNSQLLSNHEW